MDKSGEILGEVSDIFTVFVNGQETDLPDNLIPYCMDFSALKDLTGQEAAILSYIDTLETAVWCLLNP